MSLWNAVSRIEEIIEIILERNTEYNQFKKLEILPF